jgi:hypothetical protein
MFELLQTIGPNRFSELGSVYRVKRFPQAGFVAVCSMLGRMQWPGGELATSRYASFRLCLYSEDYTRRLAVLDDARYLINDLAIDTTGNTIAIATGWYDGGSFYEGELLLWNWRAATCRSLLSESREVIACRFLAEGSLQAMLRPRTEEDLADLPFDAAYLLELSAQQLTRAAFAEERQSSESLNALPPMDLVKCREAWKTGQPVDDADVPSTEAQHMARLGYEARSHVWDCCWLDDIHLAVVHVGCLLEVWSLADGSSKRYTGSGHGVQLFKRRGHHLLVHEHVRSKAPGYGPGSSVLHELQGDELVQRYHSERVRHLSMNEAGQLLARDVDYSNAREPRQDLVLRASYEPAATQDLGHFDVFNHPIRIDGADKLYFLRGSPQNQHLRKVLCAIDAGAKVDEVAQWDDKEQHLMTATACLSSKGLLVRAAGIYPSDQSGWMVDARQIDGRTSVGWERRQRAGITALALCEDCGLAVIASNDCTLRLVSLDDGATIDETDLHVDGVRVVATALAVNGNRLAAATITGSILVFRLTPARQLRSR